MSFLRGEIVDGEYQPSTIHKLLIPKITGNEINGLGETEFRRPTPIYHWVGQLKLPFTWANLVLLTDNVLDRTSMKHINRSGRIQKQPYDPIARDKAEKSPAAWSAAIREYALTHGADVAGIVPMNQDWVFDGFEIKEKWIIMLGFQMDLDELKKLPDPDGGHEVLRVYAHGQETAWGVANWLRNCGWDARGYCGPDASPISMIPAALAAGFGELGKHGSIINRKLGSNMRLAYVLTDIPLEADTVDEFGADEFCTRCQVCARECPPDAISADKQMVRGEKKWYVDFDKCVPYFNEHVGCGICLAVCPWSLPGVADKLVVKLAKRKDRKSH